VSPRCGRCLLVCLLVACGCGTKQPARPDQGPSTGKVMLRSTPSGAAVLREGAARLGETPLTIERPAGERLDLVLVKEGFTPFSLTLNFERGRALEQQVELRRLQGQLMVTSGLFKGARVKIDGEDRGTTPDEFRVDAGNHLLEVEKDGFETYRETVAVKANERREIIAILLARGVRRGPTGFLVVEVDRPAQLFLDGKALGPAPLSKLPLPARRYRLEARGEGKGTPKVQKTIEIKDGDVTAVSLKLPAR